MNTSLRDFIVAIFPIIFLILLRQYAKKKRKPSVAPDDLDPEFPVPSPIEPKWGGTDVVSGAASAGVKAHNIVASGCAVFILGAVIYGAIIDKQARLIVGITVGAMAAIYVAARLRARKINRGGTR